MAQQFDQESAAAFLSSETVPLDVARQLVAEACAHYEEPGRHYHTLEHLAELFAFLVDYREHLAEPRHVGWMMLYHDVEYNTHAASGDNEERSAQMAEARLTGLLPDEAVHEIAHGIRETYQHGADNGPDIRWFLEADLAVLGAPPARYAEYTAGIRAEYDWVPKAVFTAERVKILGSLATRAADGRTFQEPYFSQFEKQAKINVADELARLTNLAQAEAKEE